MSERRVTPDPSRDDLRAEFKAVTDRARANGDTRSAAVIIMEYWHFRQAALGIDESRPQPEKG